MDLDTSIGGNQAQFPETRRSAIVDLRSENPACLAAASETLIAGYWKPVYKYIRVRWNQSNEDAKDLTQAFFTRVLEKQFFASYDPSKARFRTYLRACLDAFLANESKAASRIKRGGAARFVSLDFETAEGEIRQYDVASGEQSPEEYFHREWVRHLSLSPWMICGENVRSAETSSSIACLSATICTMTGRNPRTKLWPANSALPEWRPQIISRPCGAASGTWFLNAFVSPPPLARTSAVKCG